MNFKGDGNQVIHKILLFLFENRKNVKAPDIIQNIVKID